METDHQSSGLLRLTFYLTYVLLITTGTITFVEALRTTSPTVRHVMNLETCISVVAGYFYSQFIDTINKPGEIDFKDINSTRYTDWFITTPLMLLVLLISLSYQPGSGSVDAKNYLFVLVLNICMLLFGYMGEKGVLSKPVACLIGFLFFIVLFGFIYFQYVCGSSGMFNYALFGAYVGIWSLYGLVYLLDEEHKNMAYNVLDVSAKCFVGLGLWAYFTKILVL
jgi:bacteriorhodopsin